MSEQWLKLDAYLLAKPFPLRLLERFGPTGLVTWIAFLAACKHSVVQGRVIFAGEADGRRQLFLDAAHAIELVDGHGQPWTLSDFFTFTGRMKQTRRTAHGRVTTADGRVRTADGRVQNVICTHWERWQNTQKTVAERERKRRSRARLSQNSHTPRIESESERENENESVGVTSTSPQRVDVPPPDYSEWVPGDLAQTPRTPPETLRELFGRIRA